MQDFSKVMQVSSETATIQSRRALLGLGSTGTFASQNTTLLRILKTKVAILSGFLPAKFTCKSQIMS